MSAAVNRVFLQAFTALAALALATHTGDAGAYCRTLALTKGKPVDADTNGCRVGNFAPSFWLNRCVGYSIAVANGSASSKVSLDDAREVVARSFATWSAALCPFSVNGLTKPSIELRDLGPVDCGKIEFNPTGTNQNVIAFRDAEWTHKSDVSDGQGATTDTSDTVLGVTILTFRPSTGEILDADMEINLTLPIKVTPKDKSEYDMQSVITHEGGHFIGIAHSSDTPAVMSKYYGKDASFSDLALGKRALTLDDRAVVCSIYRPDGMRSIAQEADGFQPKVTSAGPCDPRPYKLKFSRECYDASCSVGREVPAPGGLFAVTAIAAVALVRRRRPVRISTQRRPTYQIS